MTATWRSLDRLRGGIGLRLLARVLLFSVAITLLLTLFQLYVDYRRDVRAIDSRMSEIAGSYLQSLGEGLWNLDRRQLELQIEGILRLPAIRFVEIRETTDRADPLLVSGGRHQDSAAMSREFPLFHMARGQQEQLGVLSIDATLDDVYRALLDKAIVIVTSQGATIFLVSFFILYLTHRLVTISWAIRSPPAAAATALAPAHAEEQGRARPRRGCVRDHARDSGARLRRPSRERTAVP